MHENYFFYKELDSGYITNCTAIQIGDYYAISPFTNHRGEKRLFIHLLRLK